MINTMRLFDNAYDCSAAKRGFKAIWYSAAEHGFALGDKKDLPAGNWVELSDQELSQLVFQYGRTKSHDTIAA